MLLSKLRTHSIIESGPFNIQLFIAKSNEIKVPAARSFPFVSKMTGVDAIEIYRWNLTLHSVYLQTTLLSGWLSLDFVDFRGLTWFWALKWLSRVWSLVSEEMNMKLI